MMSEKGVKYRSSWTLQDENIENVEHVSLVPEIQRELGCLIGQHVFLEYPWAYVPREMILRLANTAGSPLEPYREQIEAYSDDSFLLGYSSTQLTANDFAICLTEDAKAAIVERNRAIARKIRNEVIEKIWKTGGQWTSLGSEAVLRENVVRNTRELFEVEVCFPDTSLGLNRHLCDRSSNESYMELLPYESFENIERRCISRMVQTHYEPREIYVQTYPGYPKNAWTQYVYEDTLKPHSDVSVLEDEERETTEERTEKESEEKKETEGSKEVSENGREQKPIERGPLELFLEDRVQEMIDAVCYNTVVNLHVDDIETLARREFEITQLRDEITYVEQFSLVDLHFTTGKVISDASWHPSHGEYVAISYVTVPCNEVIRSSLNVENGVASRATATVLLWSLADSLRPQLVMQSHQEIYCISFCPTNGDFVIGGSASGQVVVWNIHGRIKEQDLAEHDQTNAKLDSSTGSIVTVTPASMVSDRNHSHDLPIRRIQWIPDNCRIEPSGKLTRLSSRSSCQFMSIAEDGIVAIWDLLRYSITCQLKSSDLKGFDDIFRPIYRLAIRTSKDLLLTSVCLCLPSTNVLQEEKHRRDSTELDSTNVNYMKRLWIGTGQGDLACCTWEGQVFDVETSGLEECKVLSCSSVHDGPVTTILRSPHFQDILLTIGGHVFAIWKDDYSELSLFRRKSDSVYTTCCWSNRPGIFLMGTNLGDLEIWDIKRRASEPVLVQSISRMAITLLSLQEPCKHDIKLIAAGDSNSAFRIFKEPTEFENNFVERLDWFEEFIWREVRRKKMFSSWQRNFLQTDATALARKQIRIDEERKIKLEAARLQLHREHEERLRIEEEEKVRKMPQSKDVIWKMREQERMQKVLMQNKRFVPRELEEKRLPLVRLAEERKLKMLKAKNEAALDHKYFDNFVSLEFPDFHDLKRKSESSEQKVIKREEICEIYLQEYFKIRDETRRIIAEKRGYVPKFNWNTYTKMKNL